MIEKVERVSQWCYQGVWGVLTRWIRVPEQPPTLPVSSVENVETFQPSAGFLKYLKFKFWVLLLIVDVAIFVGWLLITIVNPIVGWILAPFALIIAVVPDLFAYVAIHLRFDTTWYLLSDRSIRIRRGIWIIHETTITCENIQNVTIQQGPLQRWFKISDVTIETAGGGGQQPGQAVTSSHQGLIEGIEDAGRVRQLLMDRVGRSQSSGLGDDDEQVVESWSDEHIETLEEIRDLLADRMHSSNRR